MEKDALVSYNAENVIMEKFKLCSDNYTTYFCENCETLFNIVPNCSICNTKTQPISIPYSFKMSQQLILMANIITKVEVN